MRQKALSLLRKIYGPDADFRPGQWEAIEKLVIERQRVLLVQRTAWGKSLVYFMATKLLRDQGAGLTLLISPLLALMRNQLIYTLADYALVIASDAGKGGTWAGATEALKARRVPVFVLDGPDIPQGDRQLLQKGAFAFPDSLLKTTFALREWLEAEADAFSPSTIQPKLL